MSLVRGWTALLVTLALLSASACTSGAPPDAYKPCQTCSASCKGPDGCPRDAGCALCSTCGNRAYQCANCAKRVSNQKPCEKAPICHIPCKGCQFQGREGCDKTACDCARK